MEELECDSVLYQKRDFVFDPEDIRTNGGLFYLIPGPNNIEVINADGQTVLVTSGSTALLVRASWSKPEDPLFWCVLVFLAFLTLLLSTFCCQCCLACLCSARGYERKPLGCKLFCGMLSWLLIGIIIICSAIILWSEFTMDASVGLYRDSLRSFVNLTVPSKSAALDVQQSMQFAFTYQLYRHWISVAMGIVTVLIMLGALLAVTLCTPYMESMAPMILMLVINALWTVLVASMAAVTFFSLFLTTFVCYDLYRIGGTTRCSDQSLHEESLSLQKFCSTDVYVPHLITVCAYLALVLCLIAWEIFGAFYASTFCRRSRNNKVGNTVETAEDNGEELRDRDRPTTTTTPTQQPPVTSNANPSLQNYLPANSRQTSAQTRQQETCYSSTPLPLPPQYEDCWTAP